MGVVDGATTEGSSFGHSAFGAGVTATIVEASNVGVKVGMFGRGVGGRGVMVGSLARSRGVLVGKGEEVAIGLVLVAVLRIAVAGMFVGETCPHAVRNKIPLRMLIKICFNVVLPLIVPCSCFASGNHLNGNCEILVPTKADG